MMPSFSNIRKGFTLVEIVLTISVLSALVGLGSTAFLQLGSRVAIANADEAIRSSMNRARVLAQNQQYNTNWGVYIDDGNDQIIIYSGDDYGSRDPVRDEVTPIDPAITISPGSGLDINFQQVTGQYTTNIAIEELRFSNGGIQRSLNIAQVVGASVQIANP